MGWTSTKVGSNITTKKFVEHYIRTNYDGIYEAVKVSEGKTVEGQKPFYVALRKLEDASVFGAVFLTKRHNGWLDVKVIQESEGPFFYDASKSFINVLTTPKTLEGAWWRNRCLEKESA